MLDSDLAGLYGVETKNLLQQMRRNKERFPEDFAFQLTKAEDEDLRSQIATSNQGSGGRRYRPYVFTEQGVAMLSSVLRSKQAVAVNIQIMRAFVELRQIAESDRALGRRIDKLEREMADQGKKVAAVIRLLGEVTVQPKRKRPAGFMPPGDGKK